MADKFNVLPWPGIIDHATITPVVLEFVLISFPNQGVGLADPTVWKTVRKKRPEVGVQAIPCLYVSRPSVLTWRRSSDG